MDSNKVMHNIICVGNKVTAEQLFQIKKALETRDYDVNLSYLSDELQAPTTTVLLSCFLGFLGIDRFYIGDIGLGIGKLLFNWMTFGLWSFIDMFISHDKCCTKNYDKILEEIKNAKPRTNHNQTTSQESHSDNGTVFFGQKD